MKEEGKALEQEFWILLCNHCSGILMQMEADPEDSEHGMVPKPGTISSLIQVFESELLAQLAASEMVDESGKVPMVKHVKLVEIPQDSGVINS
jgi:hypothetical protein